jgi:hypothetical protein
LNLIAFPCNVSNEFPNQLNLVKVTLRNSRNGTNQLLSLAALKSTREAPVTNLRLSTNELPASNIQQFRQMRFDTRVHSLLICCSSMPKPRKLIISASGGSGSLNVEIVPRGNQIDVNIEL